MRVEFVEVLRDGPGTGAADALEGEGALPLLVPGGHIQHLGDAAGVPFCWDDGEPDVVLDGVLSPDKRLVDALHLRRGKVVATRAIIDVVALRVGVGLT